MKKTSFVIALIICVLVTSIPTFASNSINVIINGKSVKFTESTGFPYIDENNRTMVPLRITMESAGAAVGYDADKSTAIVITEHDRIEIPIGTSILYNNNVEIQNDTPSVIKNGRTYLPIRAVLESAGYTVEWDAKTSTVNAYTFKYDPNKFVPYSTSDLKTLVKNILNGNVVYVNGGYYVTPEYIKLLLNTQVYYSGADLNIAIYPLNNNSSSSDNGSNISDFKIEWTTGGKDFGKLQVAESTLDSNVKNIEKSKIPGYVYVYAFYDSDIMGMVELIYVVDEMTDDFMNAENATGVFNGIRMKKENGKLFFNYDDLESKGLN